jgi:hypothetical protein
LAYFGPDHGGHIASWERPLAAQHALLLTAFKSELHTRGTFLPAFFQPSSAAVLVYYCCTRGVAVPNTPKPAREGSRTLPSPTISHHGLTRSQALAPGIRTHHTPTGTHPHTCPADIMCSTSHKMQCHEILEGDLYLQGGGVGMPNNPRCVCRCIKLLQDATPSCTKPTHTCLRLRPPPPQGDYTQARGRQQAAAPACRQRFLS